MRMLSTSLCADGFFSDFKIKRNWPLQHAYLHVVYVVESKGLRPFYLILEIDSANVFVLFINQSITFVANL